MDKPTGELPIVLPIVEEDEEDYGIHEHLPQPPVMMMIIASFRSGKSVLANNFILNPTMYRGKFDRWYVFSPTARNDSSSRFLLEQDNVEIIDEYTDEMLNGILQNQLDTEKDEREKIGIVFDDAIQYLHRPNGLGNFLPTRFRHYNIKFLAYISQSYKSLNRKIRNNTKSLVLMKIANMKELECIAEEYAGMLGGRQNFYDLYNYCLAEAPYSFMFINIDANPVEAWLRFETKIYPLGDTPPPAAPCGLEAKMAVADELGGTKKRRSKRRKSKEKEVESP